MDRKTKRDASALRVLVDLSEEVNISRDVLLANTGIVIENVYQPYAEIQMWQELVAIENLMANQNHLSLALIAASKVHITTLGALGFAMLSSRNVFDALQLSSEFHSISLWITDVAAQLSDDSVEFLVLPHSLPITCQSFCSVRGLASLKVWFTEMLGREITPARVRCMTKAPEDALLFEEFFGCPVEFEADSYAISFERALFVEPLKLADEWARKRCLIELHKLKDRRRSSFSNRVRDLISFAPKVNNSEEKISRTLQISGSTLRRRLREEGTTYRELRAGTLHSLACIMLVSSTKTVDEVADILGFSEAASFVRSFKRRENVAPGTWRRNERSGFR